MAYTPNNPNGQASMANSEPVVIASDQSAVPVSGTVTANLSATDNAVLDDIALDTEAIKTSLETAGGQLVNLGTNNDVTVTGTVDLGATDNAVLDAIAASVAAIDTDTTTIIGHVDGIETLIGTTNTTLTTIDGRVDGIEGLLTTIDADTGSILTAVQLIDVANFRQAGPTHPRREL